MFRIINSVFIVFLSGCCFYLVDQNKKLEIKNTNDAFKYYDLGYNAGNKDCCDQINKTNIK